MYAGTSTARAVSGLAQGGPALLRVVRRQGCLRPGAVVTGLLAALLLTTGTPEIRAADPAGAAHAAATDRHRAASIDDLKAAAQQLERAGNKRDAAATYEQIIARDPTSRGVLAPRLVELYLDTGRAAAAVACARQVAPATPAPNAYLAHVYTRLNMTTEARGLLELEIQRAPTPERAWPLRLQLSELLARTGDTNAARRVLAEGAAALPEGPLKDAAADTVHRHPAIPDEAAGRSPVTEKP